MATLRISIQIDISSSYRGYKKRDNRSGRQTDIHFDEHFENCSEFDYNATV